jgi:hypothetical protein
VFVHICLEFLISSGLSLQAFWEIGTIASWDGLFLSKLSTGLLEVVLSGDNVVINTEVWNKVILIVFVHIGLEFLIGSSLGFQASWEVSTVASWDRLLLCQFTTSILEVVLSGDNVMVNTEVWNEVVLIVFIHISLELLIGSGLGLKAFWEIGRVASWD